MGRRSGAKGAAAAWACCGLAAALLCTWCAVALRAFTALQEPRLQPSRWALSKGYGLAGAELAPDGLRGLRAARRRPVAAAAQAGGRISGKRSKEAEGILQRLRELLGSDLGLQAIQTMLEGMQYNVTRDAQIPEAVVSDLGAVESKYRRFRDISRDNVQELQETAQYFGKLLERIEKLARSGKDSSLRQISKSFLKMASRLEVQQRRLGDCVDSYGEVQEEMKALTSRVKALQEQSDSTATAVALATVVAGLLGPVALVMEEAALAGMAVVAGSAGSVVTADYRSLNDMYGKFLERVEQINAKVQDERDKLTAVDTALQDAANEAGYLGEDLTAEDFEFLADAAEDAVIAFAKLERRCAEYLESSAFDEPQGQLLLNA